jgi:xylono-1,5-lactonase
MSADGRLRRISAVRCNLGEGPLWDEVSRRLFWVDIESGTVHSAASTGSDYLSWDIGEKVGCVALRATHPGFVAGLRHSVVTMGLEPLAIATIAPLDIAPRDTRFNDGKCDAEGRFWVGTCDQTGSSASGYLYRLEMDHSIARMAGPFICTNGPAFSPDGRTLYCVDTYGRRILAFDLDRRGNLSRQRILIRFEEPTWGYPDGLTCDSTGCLWIAHWGGSRVSRFSPDGKLLDAIALPVSQPTSCTFGGDGLKTLFITSASLGLEAGLEPDAGSVFAIDVPVTGMPACRYGG